MNWRAACALLNEKCLANYEALCLEDQREEGLPPSPDAYCAGVVNVQVLLMAAPPAEPAKVAV